MGLVLIRLYVILRMVILYEMMNAINAMPDVENVFLNPIAGNATKDFISKAVYVSTEPNAKALKDTSFLIGDTVNDATQTVRPATDKDTTSVLNATVGSFCLINRIPVSTKKTVLRREAFTLIWKLRPAKNAIMLVRVVKAKENLSVLCVKMATLKEAEDVSP